MRSPGRVLQVLDRGDRAGTEMHALYLSEGLLRRGWDVELAVSHAGPVVAEFERLGVRVHAVARPGRRSPGLIASLARLIRRRGIQVVHAHSGRAPSLAARLAGAVAIETRHGLGPVRRSPRSLRLRREAALCRLSHHTVTVCACDRTLLVAAGLPAARAVHVDNGVPDRPTTRQDRASNSGPIRLAFVGRLVEQKDPLALVPICLALQRLVPNGWCLIVAGSGPLEDELRSGFHEQGLDGRIEWLGEILPEEVPWDRTDLLLLPSRWEGQPLAALEAMAAGVPTLGSRIDPLVELLERPPAAGVAAEPDPARWGEVISGMARMPDRWRLLAGQARRRFEEDHRIEPMVERIEAIYRAALAGGASR